MVALIGALFVCLLTGAVAGIIAAGKGRSGFGFFLIGFFFSILGVVIALVVSDDRRIPQLSRVKPNDLIRCHACSGLRQSASATCPHCGAGPFDPFADQRKCPACAEWVLKKARKCKHCGETLAPV